METGQKPREYYKDEHGTHPFFGMVLHYVGAAGEPAFQNSWANVGDPYLVCCFGKDVNNLVWIFGRVTGGPIDTIIFTLPANYRPNKTQSWETRMEAAGAIEINASGEVKLVS